MEKTKNALTVAMRANSNSRFGRESLRNGDADCAKNPIALSRTTFPTSKQFVLVF